MVSCLSPGLHFLLRHFPLLLFLTLAIIPLSWAWANFVTPSVWFTSECPKLQTLTLPDATRLS